MNQHPKHKKQHFLTFGVYVFIFLFAGNLIATYVMHFYVLGVSCMTVAQVASDNRCLYIAASKVYEKATRAAPHQGHPCGTDVTSVLPADHLSNPAAYLLPNYVANICAAATSTPTPKPTATPTPKPTNTPTPTLKPAATSTPIPTAKPNATATPIPTSVSHLTSTPIPTQSVSFTATPVITTTQVTPIPTTVAQASLTPTPTVDPTIPLLNLSLSLVGIDNSSATPIHNSKAITLLVYNSGDDVATSSAQPIQTIPGTISFDKTSATFTNPTFSLPNVPEGQYQFVVEIPGYIKTPLASGSATIFSVSSGTATQIPVTKILGGDIDGNNVIDIADYNGLLRCYGLHVDNPSPTCFTPQPADLNDDGVIDASDYNIFLYNLYAYKKETNTLPTPTVTPTPTIASTTTPVPTATNTPAPTLKPTVTEVAHVSITPTPVEKNHSIVSTLVAGISDNSAILTKIFDILIFLILCGTLVFGFIKSSLFAKIMKKSSNINKPLTPPSAPTATNQKAQESNTQSQGVVK